MKAKSSVFNRRAVRATAKIVVVIFALLPFLAANLSAAESPPMVHKAGRLYSLGAYHPLAPTNWAMIPEPARSRIIAHLKSRLGEAFFAKLALVGGQIIDIKELRAKEPDAKRYPRDVPVYRLQLRFSMPDLGIEYYDACLDCRSDGAVTREIDLPDIAKHPERGRFIPVAKARQIAAQNGFDPAKTEASIEFRPVPGVCVFTFTETPREYGGLGSRAIDIDAHSGATRGVYRTIEQVSPIPIACKRAALSDRPTSSFWGRKESIALFGIESPLSDRRRRNLPERLIFV